MPEVKRTVTLRAEWVDNTTALNRGCWLLRTPCSILACACRDLNTSRYFWNLGGLSADSPAATMDEAMQAAERALGAEVVEGGAE